MNPERFAIFFFRPINRSKQNFTWDALTASQTALRKLHHTITSFPEGGIISESYQVLFREMINDDLNTAGGLAVLWELLKNKDVSDADKKATILDYDRVLGLNLHLPVEVQAEKISNEVQSLIKERNQARAEKNWELADSLREKMRILGHVVSDL